MDGTIIDSNRQWMKTVTIETIEIIEIIEMVDKNDDEQWMETMMDKNDGGWK